MKTSPDGVAFIKQWEALSLTRYVCPAGKPTIGYGHVIGKHEALERITRAEAYQLLVQDIGWAEDAIARRVKVPLLRHEYDALASFVFNVGEGNFASSTLLKKINDRQLLLCGMEFPKWIYGGTPKRPMKGLLRRRLKEAVMFVG